MKQIAALLLLGMFAIAAQGQLYKWTDANGKVHYTDTPPPDSAKEQHTIDVKPASRPASASPGGPASGKAAGAQGSAPKTFAEKQAEYEKQKKERDESAAKESKKVADAKAKEDACKQAQATLRNLQSGVRLFETDEKGQRYVMSDAARAQQIEAAQKTVNETCS